MEMENILVELYGLQGKSERIKNFPYPRQYATLSYDIVWVFIALLLVAVIGIMGVTVLLMVLIDIFKKI